jgi:outer membrane biogenesis lipoprotein LolB
MYKSLLPILFACLFLTACNETPDAQQANNSEKEHATTQVKTTSKTQSAIDIDGKYVSEEGELELKSSQDKANTHFSLLVVNSEAYTGEAEGNFTLNNRNQAIYQADDCALQFAFSNAIVTVIQDGLCEMGLNVSASGVYKKSVE